MGIAVFLLFTVFATVVVAIDYAVATVNVFFVFDKTAEYYYFRHSDANKRYDLLKGSTGELDYDIVFLSL